jgi:pyrroline-5-carboxylate reductase
MRIGFVGAGNMAGAIARGWAAGEGGPDAMLFSDVDAGRAAGLAEAVGGETRGGLEELAADSDVVLLAVKPGALDDVAGELGAKAPAIVSVLAATPVARIAEAFPGVPVLRVMPNQPVEVRRGVLCYPPPAGMPPEIADRLLGLLGLLGTLVPVDEQRIDAAMAVMSSSPAFVAMFAEALTRAGEREGLDAKLAHELVVDALAGTAELLRKRGPAAVRGAVASPGGATEKGLEALEEHGLDAAVGHAVRATLERFR